MEHGDIIGYCRIYFILFFGILYFVF
ncbi:hypothetical protein M6B38_112565 [Iris pallida]|uniref:Uncharacterized protein n=1 Tax=Iris pallida TaxID=29817 RepID=A0AAX6DMT9_IRIPA|nr:hypothetical protein M6B38_112565 [Iris pallida]